MGHAHWTYAYRQARAALKVEAERLQAPCHRCGRPIRYDQPWPHPLAFTADHDPPVHVAGAHLNLVPAHARCQSLQGAGITNTIRAGKRRRRSPQGRTYSPPVTSKDWG